MTIIHKLDDFLFELFSIESKEIKKLEDSLLKFYTYGPFLPKISIEDDWVTIEIDSNTINEQEFDYKKVVSLCEKGKYSEAKPILKNLISKNPTISEYHRIMGQILSDEGNQDSAIDFLIDALRWDSKNAYALLMMGNILAKFKNDIPTAMKYYDQALIVNPNDNITINNIGGNLLQQGKLDEAKKYFWKALEINNTYANTHFALGMIAEIEEDLPSAFYSSIQALKLNKNKDPLYKNSLLQAFDVAKKIAKTEEGKKLYREFRHKLEFEGGLEIEIIEDSEILTAAKFEFAENYNRKKHLIKYKPKHIAIEHLIMHELYHLKLVIDARKNENNLLFISTQQHRANFNKELDSTIKKLQKIGIPEDAIQQYCNGLFDGLNTQMFNTPIDIFIENYLFEEFAELRPFQFLSLYSNINAGIESVNDVRTVELTPMHILSSSRILNIVNAIQFKELFGVDLLEDFKANIKELKQAQKFYAEFLEYKENKEPAEEYEMIQNWAHDLKLHRNFELYDENNYRNKNKDLDNLLNSIENDPLGIETKDPDHERDMKKFLKSQEDIGTNMAVVMFMVDALRYFNGMSKEKIKEIAFEIATQGTLGYSPDKENYRLNSIPGKSFSGYHILAYYYVSWSLSIPEMVSQLNLPYDKEYELAKSMQNIV